MAEEQTGQERTEQPTERRLQEARKKGQVPRSKELNTMLSLLLASISLLVFGGYISQNLMQISVEGFSIPRELAFDTAQLPFQFMYMASQALLALSPFMAIMLVSVFAIDGHLMLLSAVFQSFALVPLTDPGFAVTGFENVVSLGSQLFASALLLGLPTLTAVLMINVAFGVITRASPQLNIFAVGFPVTIVVGLVFLFLGMPAFIAAMQRFFETGVNQTLMVLG